MQLSEEQLAVLSAIKAGENVLVTGPAGTGKSTLLKAIVRDVDKNLPVCGSTGIAAVQVGGTTLHSWAGIGLADEPADRKAKQIIERRGKAYRNITKATRLALDEVSMIHGELFDYVDAVFRIVRDKPALPFGGVQLILFGDFLQLPPVSKDKPQRFAFQSQAWEAASIRTFLLTKIFRQADAAFAGALNRVRVGEVTDEVETILRSRYRVTDGTPDFEPVSVYTHNVDVDVENRRRLAALEGKPWKPYHASDWGEEPHLKNLQKNCLAPAELELKTGAQVMLLWNLEPEAGLANGTLGKVLGRNSVNLPIVKFRNGQTREIDRQTWEIRQGSDVLAARTQFPLRLAYAITVHKSQGMTLDKIRVHLDRAFEYGQSYVALSRVKTLDGLFIASSKRGCIKAHPSAVAFYERALGH